jgi:NAD(P)-dependent dehydrogenase (short-subunit alcohol dehydrogenase family)
MFEQGLLDGKVILVTGGGTGLGRSMSERFLELGARVAIASRRGDVLEAAAAEMTARSGGEVLPVVCDVRDAEAVERCVQAVYDRFGRLDVLVNNAAGNFISPTERLSPRAVDAVLGIVLHGTFYCTLAVGKRWIADKSGGTMLNIVTTYARPAPGTSRPRLPPRRACSPSRARSPSSGRATESA